jgi:hypothetical protein
MASGKRQPSKQKRSKQNRQERVARQARATNATAPPVAPSASKPPAGERTSRTASSAGGGPPKASLLGRLRTSTTSAPARPARASRAASSGGGRAAAAGPLRNPSAQPVGYRAALTGALAAVAAVVASFLVHAPVDANGDLYTRPSIAAEWSQTALHASLDAPHADAAAVVDAIDDWMPERSSERLFVIYWPTSLAVLLPVGASILAYRAVKDRRPSKIVTRAMYATLLGSVLTVGLLQFFIPTVIAISIASFQVRKAEMAAVRAAAAEGEADGVIEADVVDDEDR